MPKNVRFFDTPDRCFFWRRIRGQAQIEPFGLITVGQHARFGEKGAYFPHTIQTPPIKATFFNGLHIAEIGHAVLNFGNVKYIANVGCRASMKEALEMSENICTISVKDKTVTWEPSPIETFPIIKGGIFKALRNIEHFNAPVFKAPFEFSMNLTEGFRFIAPPRISWKGSFNDNEAFWEAPSIELGLELFGFVRDCIERNDA